MKELVATKDEIELIEDSVVLASDFLEEVLLPQLDKFEFENDDPDLSLIHISEPTRPY